MQLDLSRSGVVDVIFSTLEYDSGRGGHTVETVIAVLHRMGIIRSWSYTGPTWTELQVRLIFVHLLQTGQLDMRPNGTLTMPETSPDPHVEKFQGAWYATTDKGILGPFASNTEAKSACNNVPSGGIQTVGSPASKSDHWQGL